MTTSCDPAFKRELDHISSEIDTEDDIADLLEQFEAQEMLDNAYLRGEAFGDGFYEGFLAGRALSYRYERTRGESITQKHNDLLRRWGLDSL